MAGKVPNPANKSQQVSNSSGSLLKKMLIAFVIIMLAGVGFALGIYLKLIDLSGIAAKWKLHDYPVIGQYFTPPKTNFEPVEIEDQKDSLPGSSNPPVVQSPVQPPALVPPPNNIDRDKQAKIKQQEEAKRISKLARLYENMKPDEAMAILSKLDDATIIDIFSKMDESQVAKIMAQFDADRAARISQAMLKGKTPVVL